LNKNNLTIVLSNELINASHSLKIDEIRLIYIALTKVDSRKPNIGTIKIYADEFSDMFQLAQKNIWRNMQNSLISIREKTLTMKNENPKLKEKLIKWFEACNYYRSSDSGHRIELQFSDDISPYLFELKKNFTKVKANNIRHLRTPFSHRLYLWLRQEYKMKSGHYYDLKLLLSDIKERFLIPVTSYTKWRDFKQRILQPAVDEINSKTNLSVSFDTKKRSNKIHLIEFTYIDESQKTVTAKGGIITPSWVKPARPRLTRRPKVCPGSAKEGEWARKNYNLLKKYLKDLKSRDPSAKLTMQDLKRNISYTKIFDSYLYKKFKNEQIQRQRKNTFSKEKAA